MRSTIIIPFYRPSIGGVEYIVYHTARELARKGFEVHIVTTTHDNRWRKVAQPGMTIEEGVHVHRLQPSIIRVGYATIMKDLKETLRKIKPDIVHCHNLHPHLFQAMKWKAELKYKLVAQLHHPIATGIDHLSARLLYGFVVRGIVKNQHKIDAFIAHTNMEKQWLINEGIEEDKVHIIRYPCIPDELFKYKPKTDIHDKLGTDIVITYISRMHPRKGQHLLIQATRYLKEELRDFKVYIAGPISDHKYLQKLKKLVEELDLGKHVVLDPRVLSEQEKLDTIATSDIFACTPILDIHPIIILEALALGTPVIATNVGAIPELLGAYSEHHTILGKLVQAIPPLPQKIAYTLQTIIAYTNNAPRNHIQRLAQSYKTSLLTEKLVYNVYKNL